MTPVPRRVALFIRSFAGGGVERMTTRLAGALLARGAAVDVVVMRDHGPNRAFVPDGARVVALRRRGRLSGLAWLARRDPALAAACLRLPAPELLRWIESWSAYLAEARPDLAVSAMSDCNLIAAAGRRLAPDGPTAILTERNPLALRMRLQPSHRRRFAALTRRLYPAADRLVGISADVARDLEGFLGLPVGAVAVVRNPAFEPDILTRAADPADHPWFDDAARAAHPVVLSVGRLHPQKDYATLLRAVALLREGWDARATGRGAPRLAILGDGKLREALLAQARDLGIAEAVSLPGYAANPYAFMARADVFALSSVYEGFGNVTVEALACGCPVVAADSPGGQREILDGGRFGRLVPPGDAAAMAAALRAALTEAPDRAALRARAAEFSATRSAEALLAVWASAAPERQHAGQRRAL